MALGRLLLLCLVASALWDAETKPIKFVCDKSARRALNIVAGVESALSNCDGSFTLSTLVRLPCVELHVASWENKSQQEKRGDIVASFTLLAEGVEEARTLSQPGCATSLLQKLENNIRNYLLILGNLQLRDKKKIAVHTFQVRQSADGCPVIILKQGATVSPTLSCVPGSTQSLSTVLLHYNLLISGKLERFMVDLKDRCTS